MITHTSVLRRQLDEMVIEHASEAIGADLKYRWHLYEQAKREINGLCDSRRVEQNERAIAMRSYVELVGL